MTDVGNLILYPPYAKDIRKLLTLFLSKQSLSFQDFKNCWKELGFTLIFEGTPEEVDYKVFVHELFYVCLGYLARPLNPMNLRIGVIYALYLLYFTQPSLPKIKIPVTLELYEEITKMETYAHRENLKELYHVIKRLKEDNCLSYSAFVIIDPHLSSLEPPTDVSFEMPKEIDFQSVKKVVDTMEDLNVRRELYETEKKKYKNMSGLDSLGLAIIDSNAFDRDLNEIRNQYELDKTRRKKLYETAPERFMELTTNNSETFQQLQAFKKKKKKKYWGRKGKELFLPSSSDSSDEDAGGRADDNDDEKDDDNGNDDDDVVVVNDADGDAGMLNNLGVNEISESSFTANTKNNDGVIPADASNGDQPPKKRRRKTVDGPTMVSTLSVDLLAGSIDAFLFQKQPNLHIKHETNEDVYPIQQENESNNSKNGDPIAEIVDTDNDDLDAILKAGIAKVMDDKNKNTTGSNMDKGSKPSGSKDTTSNKKKVDIQKN